MSQQIPRIVILDLDETLGSFTQDISTLISLAHAFHEDPHLRLLSLETKSKILQSTASKLAQHHPRKGVGQFLKMLYFLKVGPGLVKKVIIITKARKSREPLFDQLETSPQKLLVHGLLQNQSIPTRFISDIVFVPPLRDVPKDLRDFKDPLWIMDDLSLQENYVYHPNQDIKSFQVSPYFGKHKQSTYWPRLLKSILIRQEGTERFSKHYIKDLEGKVEENYTRLRGKRQGYEQKYGSKEVKSRQIEDAITALIKVLDSKICQKDLDCDSERKQKCVLGFCADPVFFSHKRKIEE
jgi:hypothetical protein